MQAACVYLIRLGLTLLSCIFPLYPALSQAVSMDNSKPIIVLVPGAWLPNEQYTDLLTLLLRSGYSFVMRKLPSVNSATPNDQTVMTDAESIRQYVLIPQINSGRDVVLLMHSYGGIPGPVAAVGLSKQELSAQGKPGEIIGIIMLSAFIAGEGLSLLDKLINRQYSPWIRQFVGPASVCVIIFTEETHLSQIGTGQLGIADPPYRFYNDLPTQRADILSQSVGLQSQKSFDSPAGAPAWANNTIYNNRRLFLKTLLDHVIPPMGQAAFMASSGVTWSVQEFEASHCSFISQPKEIAAAVMAAATAFQGAGLVGTSSQANSTSA